MFLPKDAPPPHPLLARQVSDSWSKMILPSSLAENLSWLVLCQSCQIPSNEAEASIWDLVFSGNRGLVWAPQLFHSESWCSSTTERVLLANSGARPIRRDAVSPLLSKLRHGSLPPALWAAEPLCLPLSVCASKGIAGHLLLKSYQKSLLLAHSYCSDCLACCWGHHCLQTAALGFLWHLVTMQWGAPPHEGE